MAGGEGGERELERGWELELNVEVEVEVGGGGDGGGCAVRRRNISNRMSGVGEWEKGFSSKSKNILPLSTVE